MKKFLLSFACLNFIGLIFGPAALADSGSSVQSVCGRLYDNGDSFEIVKNNRSYYIPGDNSAPVGANKVVPFLIRERTRNHCRTWGFDRFVAFGCAIHKTYRDCSRGSY